MNKKIFSYDWFKLFVLIVLLIVLAVLLLPGNSEIGGVEVSKDAEKSSTQISATYIDEEPAEPEPYMGFPEMPAGADVLAVNDERNGLIDDGGNLIYLLSEDERSWQPVVPDGFAEGLPEDFQIKQDGNGVWHILTNTDISLYSFGQNSLSWIKVAGENGIEDDEMGDPGNERIECSGANLQRISGPGDMVRVVNAVIPLRRTPDVSPKNLIVDLQMGDILEVVDGPVCSPFLNRANLWWHVRTADGIEGFAAEGSAISDIYYLEEISVTP